MSEVPLESTPDLSAAAHDAADRGRVVYLTEQGQRLAAIVPAEVAAAGAAALEALEDAADANAARQALTEWEDDGRRTYSLTEVDAELAES